MIKPLPTVTAKSPETFIDIIRMLLDLAFAQKLNYLSVSYRVAGNAKPVTVLLSDDGAE